SRFAPGEVQCGPPDVTFSFELLLDWGSAKASLSKATGEEGWQMVEQISSIARGQRSIEVRLPLQSLGLKMGQSVGVYATVGRDGILVETLPDGGHLSFNLAHMV
ncbi:MAG: hypothetical protein Q7O66_09735, partial [Dehalococcoidia bacterium]|nr:hypothetical protein [Dehalococcoidia bacterium]